MAMTGRNLLRGVFTYRDRQGRIYRQKRDADVADNVVWSDKPCFGLAGSDVLREVPRSDIDTQYAAPIRGLRFALATSVQKADSALDKLANQEPLIIGSSYPNTARRTMGRLVLVSSRGVQGGGIESLPDQYKEIDAIFELVRSGDSLRANNLVVIEDYIETVSLMTVVKKNGKK